MKNLLIAVFVLVLCGSALAVEPAPHFSGQDYLNLSYQQRAKIMISFIEHGKQRSKIGTDTYFY